MAPANTKPTTNEDRLALWKDIKQQLQDPLNFLKESKPQDSTLQKNKENLIKILNGIIEFFDNQNGALPGMLAQGKFGIGLKNNLNRLKEGDTDGLKVYSSGKLSDEDMLILCTYHDGYCGTLRILSEDGGILPLIYDAGKTLPTMGETIRDDTARRLALALEQFQKQEDIAREQLKEVSLEGKSELTQGHIRHLLGIPVGEPLEEPEDDFVTAPEENEDYQNGVDDPSDDSTPSSGRSSPT